MHFLEGGSNVSLDNMKTGTRLALGYGVVLLLTAVTTRFVFAATVMVFPESVAPLLKFNTPLVITETEYPPVAVLQTGLPRVKTGLVQVAQTVTT